MCVYVCERTRVAGVGCSLARHLPATAALRGAGVPAAPGGRAGGGPTAACCLPTWPAPLPTSAPCAFPQDLGSPHIGCTGLEEHRPGRGAAPGAGTGGSHLQRPRAPRWPGRRIPRFKASVGTIVGLLGKLWEANLLIHCG